MKRLLLECGLLADFVDMEWLLWGRSEKEADHLTYSLLLSNGEDTNRFAVLHLFWMQCRVDVGCSSFVDWRFVFRCDQVFQYHSILWLLDSCNRNHYLLHHLLLVLNGILWLTRLLFYILEIIRLDPYFNSYTEGQSSFKHACDPRIGVSFAVCEDSNVFREVVYLPSSKSSLH